jgi:hypothetical protein
MKVTDFLKAQINIIEWHRKRERRKEEDSQQVQPS